MPGRPLKNAMRAARKPAKGTVATGDGMADATCAGKQYKQSHTKLQKAKSYHASGSGDTDDLK